MDPLEINKVEIRNLQREDYDQLAASFTRVYADGSDVFWTPEQIDKLIRIFPEGQIVVVIDDKIVGCAPSTPTPAKAISSTVSRSSSIPTTGDCGWRGACMSTARNYAKNST